MKRWLAALMALLGPLALVVGTLWLTAKPGLPEAAQARLTEYLQDPARQSTQIYRARRVSHAARPWNFTAAMSGATYGHSVYYQTTDSRAGQRPLPYPPRDLWCVWLSGLTTAGLTESHLIAARAGPFALDGSGLSTGRSSAAPADNPLVYLAQHEDLYNADWIVHEPRADLAPGDWQAAIAAVGCVGPS